MTKDIRWEQRFSNFKKAFFKLEQSVNFVLNKKSDLNNNDNSEMMINEMIQEGLIHRFEYTHELASNVMKDYAAFQGNAAIGGSRDATRESFKLQLINDGEVWMDMIGIRNKTSHTYNEEVSAEISSKILKNYFPEFVFFSKKMEEKISGSQQRIL